MAGSSYTGVAMAVLWAYAVHVRAQRVDEREVQWALA